MSGRVSTPFKSALRIGGWLLIALLLRAQVSCSDAIVGPDSDVPDTIVRTYEGVISPATKTALSDVGDVSWTAGDWIWYYSKDGGLLRMHTVAEDAASATMSLTLDANAEYLTAIYGTSTITNYSKDALSLANIIKAEQTGSFKDGHAAIARITNVEESTLKFYNIVSFISFSTKRTDVAYVIFAANDDTALHANGSVNVQYEESIPIASLGSSKSNSIKVILNGAGKYYIATLPMTIQNGFTVSCYDSSGKLIGTATGHNPLSINRSSIAQLGLIDSRLVNEDGIKLDDYGDDTNWDSNGDSNGDITQGYYGDDYNWDTDSDSNGNIDQGGYGDDSNYDSDGNSGGNLNQDGYGDDSDWDSSSNSGGGLNKEGYGDDSNWG